MLPIRRVLLIAAIGIVVYALDRFTKALVVSAVPVNDAREVVDGWVRVANVRNTGAAMGLFQERTSLLSLLSVVAVLVIVYYYRGMAARSLPIAATLGMQLGGAIGNLVDRVGQGYVTDFVDVGVPDGWRIWAFNVADSSIVVGIILVTLLLWLEEQRERRPALP